MNVRLEQIAGGDPYAYYSQEIGHGDHSPFGINGLELKADGKVYVLGHSSNLGPPALRQYDIDGNYLQTIFPPPAGKPVEAMRGWGIHVKPDGTYTPQFNRLTDPSLSTTFLDTGTGGMARLFPTPDVAGLSFLQTGFGRDSFNLLRIRADGTISEDPAERSPGPLVVDPPFELGPIAPDSHVVHSLLGPVFTCFAADGKSFYLSGIYAATTQYGSLKQHQPESVWRDGQVWKVDAQTRKARVVFALDPEEVAAATKDRKAALGGSANYAALHGVAEDPQGNLFIADRLHRRIVVLDRAGKVLRELAVEHPDAVAVSARTAALYVTTRYGDEYSGHGQVQLLKFADWRKDDQPAATLLVSETGFTDHHKCSYVLVCEAERASNVWVAYTEMPVRIYRDDAAGFNLLKDFYRIEGAQRCLGFDRLEIDQQTGEVYVLDDHRSVWKIGDWKDPAFVKIPLLTASIAIDVRHRQIYTHAGRRQHVLFRRQVGPVSPRSGRLSAGQFRRFAHESLHRQVPLRVVLHRQRRPGICHRSERQRGPRGGSQRRAASVRRQRNESALGSDQDRGPARICRAARFDLQGNLYVGYADSKPTSTLPGFGDDRFAQCLGRIHKFAPTGSLAGGNLFPQAPAGPARTYDVPYGAFDADCIVRTPRFGVDGFGRIYYPTNIAQRVAVMDNAGNEILSFGTYGNRDSLGGLPGDRVPTPGIPLAFPNSVDATDDFIYVGDMVNLRLLRIRKTFQQEATSR